MAQGTRLPSMPASRSAASGGGGAGGAFRCLILAALVFSGLIGGCAGRPGPEELDPRTQRTRMIVVLKDDESLRIAREMCTGEHRRDLHRAALHLDLDPECYLPEGVCKRVFRRSIRGVCGEFTSAEVILMRKCIPDGIKYVEEDAPVEKQAFAGGGITFVPAPPEPSSAPVEIVIDGDTTNSPPTSFTSTTEFTVIPPPDVSSIIPPDVALPVPAPVPAVVPPLVPPVPVAPAPAEPTGPVTYSFDNDGEPQTSFDLSQLTDPGVKVQELHIANWNLDRIDQRDLPLDKRFSYGTETQTGTGKGVTVYVLDSGIRITHREFKDWEAGETRAELGYDFVDDDEDASDCNGHGTLVASTAIGKTVGIAKEARGVSVRVLDCDGNGDISTTVAGLDWVAERVQKPAVVAMSLGVAKGRWSRTLEETVKSMINDHGTTVIVAAGNSAVDSCSFAPANVPETITVGATELATKNHDTSQADKETLYEYSNSGPCVDIFAPGVDVFGACGGDGLCSKGTDEAYTWSSGTSIALPAVAGVAAVYLGEYPDATPGQVKEAIISSATLDKIEPDLMKPDTPNRLLYSNVL